MSEFKHGLARVFDDDLRTKQWNNYVDYAILGLIVVSTVEIFLSTFDVVSHQYGEWLSVIDHFTTFFFTLEVTLRIWSADIIDEKYQGWKGRIKYCFSFYGLIDLLSTYTFYLAMFITLPYTTFKVLRVVRLLRIFRYIKAFRILSRAICSKRDELVVSIEFLTIVTLILSFVLFFMEHEVQPEVYDNGFVSVLWAFMQYVGDPGGFADTPPITTIGRGIATILGILGIAIFAVPAGLIGSAFSEVMEAETHKKDCRKWGEKLRLAFERKLDRPSGYQICPRYLSMAEIQARMGMKENEIHDAISSSKGFRLINLASTQPIDEHPQDRLAVEVFAYNTPYGLLIDRGSRITIFSPSSMVDPIIGWWGYYLALIGGFNYVSREFGSVRPYQSFYIYKPENGLFENQQLLMDDLNRLLDNDSKWIITLMAASGSLEPAYPTQFHFGCGAKLGDEGYDDPHLSVHDVETYQQIIEHTSQLLQDKYQLDTDSQRYHNNSLPTHFFRHLTHKVNAVQLRVAWSVTCWDMRAIQIAKDLAQVLNQRITQHSNPEVPVLKKKAIGLEGY